VTALVRDMVQILTNVKNIVNFSNTISNIDLIDTVKNGDLVIIMEDMALKMAVDMDFNTIIHLKGVLTIDKMKDRVLNTEIAMMDEVLTINEKETYQINMVKVREVLSMVALLHTAVVTVHPNRVDINMLIIFKLQWRKWQVVIWRFKLLRWRNRMREKLRGCLHL
jgi:hypothetical protein